MNRKKTVMLDLSKETAENRNLKVESKVYEKLDE